MLLSAAIRHSLSGGTGAGTTALPSGGTLRMDLPALFYGQRFVMVQELEEAAPEHRQIIYIPDFFEELKAKMAEAGQ